MTEKGRIEYAGRTISFTIARTDRNRLTISVSPDLSVSVTAPQAKSLAEVEGRVRRRGAWLVRQIEDLERFLPKQPPRRYISGESHRYLGRQYRLKVERAVEARGVKLKGAYLHVHATDPSSAEEVKTLLDTWYRARARELFHRYMEEAVERHSRRGLRATGVRLQHMKKRWGSYTSSGTILLNPALIMAPIVCIEYVIVHELCHGKIPHHGPKFEALLTRCMPDWKERKERLERASR